MRRGRYATFPAEIEQDGNQSNGPQGTLVFTLQTEEAGTVKIDLSSWPLEALTREIAPFLQEYLRRMGPVPLWKTAGAFVGRLRRFWRFLAAKQALYRLEDLTPTIINAYENWLEQNGGERPNQRNLLGALIGVLRVVAELDPERLPAETLPRLKYIGHGEHGVPKPRDAYSGNIAAALLKAAMCQINEARNRIATGDDLPPPVLDVDCDLELRHRYDLLIAQIVTTGTVPGEGPLFDNLRYHAHRCGLEPPPVEELHAGFHLTRYDVVGFLVWLSLMTGLEIEALRGLEADCLRNPNRGYVEVEYRKRRAHHAQWKRLRVRDGGRETPGAVLRLAITLTERARQHTGSTKLWITWKPRRLSPPKRLDTCVAAFVAKYGIIDDDGKSLALNLSRLRKTQKADWYKRTGGQLEIFAVGHTIPVAANHYADIPALRHLHEQTIIEALADAMVPALRPRIVLPADEARLRTSAATTELPVAPEKIGPLLDGVQDLWLAACGSFRASPFGREGEVCPTPFWGCLECPNAVITARKLPALIAFQAFMDEQREALPPDDWSEKFDLPYRRITEQILPMFPASVVGNARVEAAESSVPLLYLPPEAYGS
ncbi:hypothetical protein [Mesorhizobium delmotii]|uniref:Core-binding (CB) domain-containing protein n=1 Tax=Mesorhizobium delmotii TaxID=1631247 RepID=A0A2P9AVN5_9HYPH|nr:hypothetical protein [Mesorhizobium delmotii]SJM35262.1 conserved hypothetical protein [Mesorhizobium delmotii]